MSCMVELGRPLGHGKVAAAKDEDHVGDVRWVRHREKIPERLDQRSGCRIDHRSDGQGGGERSGWPTSDRVPHHE